MKSNITGTAKSLQIGKGPRIVGDTDNFIRLMKSNGDSTLVNSQVDTSKANVFLSRNFKYTDIATVIDNTVSLSDGLAFKTGKTDFATYSSGLTDVNPITITLASTETLTGVSNLSVSLGESGDIVSTNTICVDFQGDLSLFAKTLQDSFDILGLGFTITFNTSTLELTITQSSSTLYIYEFSLYNGVYDTTISMNEDYSLSLSSSFKNLALTGNSTAVTQDISDSSNKVATTEYVKNVADNITAISVQASKNYYLGLDGTDPVMYDTAPVTETLVPFEIVYGSTTTKTFDYTVTEEITLSPSSTYYFWLWTTADTSGKLYTLTGELYYLDDLDSRVDIVSATISITGTGNPNTFMLPMGNSLLTETTRLGVGKHLYMKMSVSSDNHVTETISVYTGGSNPSYLARNGTEISTSYVIGTYKGESHTQEYINNNKQDKAPDITVISETNGTVVLADTSLYTMTINGDTAFTLPTISGDDLNYYHEINMLLNVTSVPTTMNWGTTAHNITLTTGYFDVVWKYNPLRSLWVCSATKED